MSTFTFKKKYGQNFLIDRNIVLKIVADLEIKPKSLVMEIGAGDGKLTKILCEKFDQVLSYEIDRELEHRLNEGLIDKSNYNIIFDDFLNRDLEKDLSHYNYDNLYIIANLPYYITTPIIEKIINSSLEFESMRIMVQKEVGDRFTAKVKTKEYNSLTIYLNYNYDVKKEFIVKKNSFYPKPNVDSMVVSFVKKKNKLKVENEKLFYKLIKDSFRYKRKTLRNNLKDYDFEKISSILKKYNYKENVRAEELPIDMYCNIVNEINK